MVDELASEQFEVGTATKVITPSREHTSMGGFFRNKRAQGTLDDLHARAMYLTNRVDPPYLLIACELLGIPFKSTQIVRKRISRLTGIPVHHISVHGTHTHSGPDTTGIFRVPILRSVFRAFPERQAITELHRRLVEVGVEASDPAGLSGPVHFGIAHKVPDPPLAARRRGNRGGITRPVTVLSLTTRPGDPGHPPEVVVVNYAAHPTFIPNDNYTFSADYPGRVIEHLERLLGSDPAKTTCMYLNGACGDVSIRYGVVGSSLAPELHAKYPELDPSTPEYDPRAFQKWTKERRRRYVLDWRILGSDHYGRLLALEAAEALKRVEYAPLAGLEVGRKTILVRLGDIPFPKLKWTSRQRRYSLHKLKNWFTFKAKIALIPRVYALVNHGMTPHFLSVVRRNKRSYVRTEIQAVRLDAPGGDDPTFLLYAPGEPFAALADQIKQMTGTGKHLFAELVNDSPGYIFPYREFLLGGYENMFAFSPLTGQQVVDGFREVLADLGAPVKGVSSPGPAAR
ncbi:MAG: hypothetical protein ACTSU5_09010 [Promethearchaeota archaeon]